VNIATKQKPFDFTDRRRDPVDLQKTQRICRCVP